MGEHYEPVRVAMTFEVEDDPVMVYVWSHIGAGWLADALLVQGIAASVMSIEINGSPEVPL